MMDLVFMMIGGFVDFWEQSKYVEDLIWEDVKDSIDMVNLKDNLNFFNDFIVIK